MEVSQLFNAYNDEQAEIAGIVREITQLNLGRHRWPRILRCLRALTIRLSGFRKQRWTRQTFLIKFATQKDSLNAKKYEISLKQVRTASVIPTEGVSWLDELRTLASTIFNRGSNRWNSQHCCTLLRESDRDSGFTPKNLRTYLT